MRGAICLLVMLFAFGGCAQPYLPTSKNPALVRVPVSASFGVGDQIYLVAIDGVSVDAATNRGEWQIDPGMRRLTISYEASKKIVGPRVASSPLVLSARLEASTTYEVVCKGSNAGVKAFVRQRSNGRTVSNVAESSLIQAPPTYPSPPPNFQIPVIRRH